LTGNTAGDQAYVTAVNRFYIFNGTGWYSISLVNTNPNITSVADASSNTTPFTLSTDGSASVITITATDPEDVPLTYTYSVTSGSLSNGGGTTATVVQGTGSNTNKFTVTPSTTEAYAGTFSLTFTASDGINTATSANSFTLNFITIVTNSKYTTLLATATGTSDNNNIADTSSNNHSITVTGDAYAGTFSPYRSGGYSTYFDGTGDYLRTPTINLSGDFTIQFFVNLNAIATDVGIFSFGTLTSANTILELYNHTSGQFRLYSSSGGELGASSAVEANKWYHVAITRSGNTFKAYLDGVEFASDTTARTINSAISIGGYVNTSYLMNGHIRDFRITTNVEYSNNNFTPPSEPLTAVSGTVLLTCHLPYIADGSTNDHSITINGNTSTKPYSPYNYNEYSTTDNGGSVYFDGDSLNTTATQIIPSTSFTVTAWVYLNDTTDGAVWGQGTAGHSGRTGVTIDNNNWFAQIGSANLGTSTSVSAGRWYYTDLQWDGSTLKFFVDGTLLGSVSNSNSPTNSAFYIGDLGSAWSTAYPLNGYVSDLKVVSGTPSGSSTVPTSPLSSSGAALYIKGTDASIIDKSQGANLKLFGTTTGSTTTKFTGAKSMYFAGSLHDKVIAYAARDVDIPGNGEYTFEAWCYFNSVSGVIHMLSSADVTNRIAFELRNSKLAAMVGGSVIQSGSQVLSTGQWYHLAISRVTGSPYSTTRFFVNGNLDQTATNYQQSPAIDGFNEWIIGSPSPNNLGNGYNEVTGYMQDVRFTEGLGRYTANFTPPTASLEG
jgi:hypothetical protein